MPLGSKVAGLKLYYDKYWEVEWAIVLSQCGGAHISSPTSPPFCHEMWLCDWAWAESCNSGRLQSYSRGCFLKPHASGIQKQSDKLLSRRRIIFFFHFPARLGRHVIEREHANKANDFPPTLHFFPWGSCLPRRAHASFTKYSSVSADPPHTHTTVKMSPLLWQK